MDEAQNCNDEYNKQATKEFILIVTFIWSSKTSTIKQLMVEKTMELSQKWGYWLSLGEGRECIRAYMVPATFSF